jgi:hypothetical protein
MLPSWRMAATGRAAPAAVGRGTRERARPSWAGPASRTGQEVKRAGQQGKNCFFFLFFKSKINYTTLNSKFEIENGIFKT